jgi:hypothetical protein
VALPTLVAVLLLLAGCTSDEEGLLLEDRFGNPEENWGVESQSDFDRGYQDGEYFIEVYRSNWLVWAIPGERFTDVDVAVDARRVSASAGGNFGLLCRYTPPETFYYFAISQDGFYAILYVEEGVANVLTGDGFLPSPAIRTGEDAVNRIRAVCEGDRLGLYVNDQEVASVIDLSLRRGDVGLAVGSGPDTSTRIHFDNLIVVRPDVTPEEVEE